MRRGVPRRQQVAPGFGTRFENECSLDLSTLLTQETIFYDPYIVDVGGAIYPVMVKVLNYQLPAAGTTSQSGPYSEVNEVRSSKVGASFTLRWDRTAAGMRS